MENEKFKMKNLLPPPRLSRPALAFLAAGFLSSFCLLTSAFSALAPNPSPGGNAPAPAYFNRADLILTGSYYYPEHWPQNLWEADLKKMAELGFEFTHYGEFAWAMMEPEEGKYDFTWLDEAIELAAKYKIKVILCTPTPTPPAWLALKHPEILMVKQNGRQATHGGRAHASWSSLVYRDYVEKIVTALATRYAKNPHVIGWQLDNEPSHYGAQYDYSPDVEASFRRWLQKKYTTIAALNHAWGTAFWSQTYNTFAQIGLPNGDTLPIRQPNPHAWLDFKRFTSQECADFLHFQYAVLRRHVPRTQWITTNFMHVHPPIDPADTTGLDFLTYTKYLVAGFDAGHGPQGFRLGSATNIALCNDYFRNLSPYTGVMELQPGQVNWGAVNPQPLPGAVRLWLWHTFAGGNVLVCNYRFDRPIYGGEQYHYAILDADRTTVTQGGKEYVQFINEVKTLRQAFNPATRLPANLAKLRTAFLYSADNLWETDNQPQTSEWSFQKHFGHYYEAIKSFGAPTDILTERAALNPATHPYLIAPAYQLLDEKLIARWTAYVQAGGHLVLTARTGQKDRNAHIWPATWAAPMYPLIGSKITGFDLIPPAQKATVKTAAGKSFVWNNWGDFLEPAAGTETLATYADQFYAGQAAATRVKLGQGTVTYIGVDTDTGEFEAQLLRDLYTQTGAKPMSLPEGVQHEWRDGFHVVLNYSPAPYTAEVPATAKILLGEKKVPTPGVLIWQD